ncbi:MAG: antA/AntB antirepressor family protein [Gilliamella sp.]|uniref:antA/AntB antirepressor family protein n=1 Tax=Gilliamella TaxID=1193503 RepID=UPI000A16AE45|nr:MULTISPECIES: antA/AntB antirepressor family protein [Gilliamella]MCO6539802.1 antA/AntB antirepressor family protein [Gilliamella sp.]
MTDFNNLVPVTETQLNGKLQQTVSAKALHNYLKVGNDFSTWIKGRIKEYGLIKNDDFLIFDSSEFRNQSTNNEQQIKWTTKRGGDRKSTDYILTIGTAKELAMIENNEKGRAIRKYFIRCEEHLKEIAPTIQKKALNRLKARLKVADYSRPMCDALTEQRKALGKSANNTVFTNEFDMINRIVLGTTSSKYKKANNLTGNIRDHLNEFELNHIAYLENANITLIHIGYDYHQRKAELIKLSHAYLIRHMAQVA